MISKATYPDLADRRVLITGGATGIGATLVRAFAQQGARVTFLDIQSEPAEALLEELAGCRHRPTCKICDLTDIPALKASLAEAGEAAGPFEALVNNAANDQRHNLEDVTVEDWDWSQAVNLRHQFFAIQAVAPGMKAMGGGAIVNLSSIAWMGGTGQLPVYASAKAAVVGLTNATARDLGRHNIRVNAIAPGAVMTERQRRLWHDEASIANLVSRQCIPRTLGPGPVARMALFLASDEADMITKQVFIVDAGLR